MLNDMRCSNKLINYIKQRIVFDAHLYVNY